MADLVKDRSCSKCGERMRLAYIIPRFGRHPEIIGHRCDSCGETVTEETKEDG